MWEDKQTNRRYRQRSAALSVVVALLGLLSVALGASPAAADPTGVSVDTAMDLREDGLLVVKTVITAPDGRAVSQRLPLDVTVEGNRVQHFSISDLRADNGSATVADSALQVSAPGGRTTVEYLVRGTVENGPELQQVTWPLAAGYTVTLDKVTASFTSPSPKTDSPLCGIGQPGERRLCTLTQTDASGRVTMEQNGLAQGKVAAFTVLLPSGTVPATADFTASDAGGSAPRDTGGLIALSIATVIAAAAVVFALLRRRADAAAADSAGPTADLLTPSGSGIAFASPDGVLPGQIGTLLGARVRAADFGATVLDLAVRGYLWIAELPGGHFQISRRAPLDPAITDAERAVVRAILPDDAESTSTAELVAGARPVTLGTVRSAVRASVAQNKWIRSSPARSRVIAGVILVVGVVASLVCAFLNVALLYALAVLVLGVGLTAAAVLLPQRTVAGSRLAAGVGGMRQYLIATNVGALAEPQRAILFQRALPYSHAFGDLRGWIGTWGNTVTAPLDWYRSTQGPVAGLTTLSSILDGIAAQSEAGEERD